VGARYLRAQLDRNLPPINEATVDLDLYPAEIGTLLKGYYDFNVTFPVYKALIAGLHDSQFDHHVEFHPCDQRIRRLIYVKNIDPHSELARYGFRDGQIILFSVTRYEPLMTQAEHLTRFFDLLSIRRFEGDRPDDNNALLVLRRKA